jgi:hypothetical protein
VGADPMTVDFALRLASAAARVLIPDGGTVLIGKDTRVSGYMFESALEAGFVAAGVDVLLTGPLPTPAVAHMTRHLHCKLGVVISASHNPYEDNGIKFFNGEGPHRRAALCCAAHLRFARAGPRAPLGSLAAALPGVLRRGIARGYGSVGTQGGDRLRQWRGLQGGAAHTRRPGGRHRADRLFPKRPQYQ